MEEYVEALQEADLDRMLALFTPGAEVTSPLEGTCDAVSFYTRLFKVTKASRVRMLQGFLSPDDGSASAFLEYDWTLTNGSRTRFECVDLFGFDEKGSIRSLKIFYDPAGVRSAYETVSGSVPRH